MVETCTRSEEPRYLRESVVCKLYCIGRTTLRELVKRKEIPPPIPITKKIRVYDREAMDAWIAQKIEASRPRVDPDMINPCNPRKHYRDLAA